MPDAPEVAADDFAVVLAPTRDFVRKDVLPREREIMDTDALPDDLRAKAKAMGLFGSSIPQQWGGLGLDLSQDVLLAMELGYTSLALRSMFGTNNGIAGQVLVNFGTDEQKAEWLPRLSSGEVVASFALTEPGAGSNPAGLKTRAVRDGDDRSSTTTSGGSPTRRSPTCSSSSRAPARPTSPVPASRCSSSRPTRRGSRWA